MTKISGAVLVALVFILLTEVNAQNQSKIGQRLLAFVEEGRIQGAVTLVIRRGQVVNFEAVGYQDLEQKTPMRTDTIFDIRSMTKPFTAIAILILMEDGKLALNDAVEKYLPEFRDSAFKDGPHPITIRHQLTHTAGLPLYCLPISQEMPIKRNQTLAEYVSFLSKQTPEYEPGTQHRYSGGGFAILGRVIEVISGMPYERFMRERVFVPLGMKDSFFFVPVDKQNRVASIYRMENGKLTKWEELMAFSRTAKYPGPEFGMYSTASDLSALCQMLLDGGIYKGRRILSRLSVQLMTSNHVARLPLAGTHRPAFHGFGLGLWGDPAEDFPLTTRGSFGHNGAFGGLFWADPEEGLIRIYLEHVFGSGNESDIFMAMAATL
jgi:CubicO group peptidase (beta-lactamase class C family)